MSIALQYTIVAFIVLLSLVVLCVASYRNRKNGRTCSGCALSNTCTNSKNKNRPKTNEQTLCENSSVATNSQCSAKQYKPPVQEKQ